MYAKCIDNSHKEHKLTIGKIYPIISCISPDTPYLFVVINDMGKESKFAVSRFKLIDWKSKFESLINDK